MYLAIKMAAEIGALVGPVPAVQASVIVLGFDFEGLGNLEAVDKFYNNGLGDDDSWSGADYGVGFSGNFLVIIDTDGGGGGNFGGESSPDTVLFFQVSLVAVFLPDG